MAAYELWIEVRSRGASVSAAPAGAAACVEDALFRDILEGRLANDGSVPAFEIAPDGARASDATGLVLRRAGAAPRRYPREVFAAQARHAIRELVAAGRLEAEAPVEWSLAARPRAAAPAARLRREPYPLRAAELPGSAPGRLAVEAEARLLDRLQREVVAAGAIECAALLLGELLHDPARRSALLRLREHVPLPPAAGGASRLHFSLGPTSFLAGRRATREHRDGLVVCGWVHSHPPCEPCFARSDCRTQTVFFSAQDEEVHAAAFASPYMVGLVAGKVRDLPARRPGFRLYGWEAARVVARRFDVVGPGADGFRAELRSGLEAGEG